MEPLEFHEELLPLTNTHSSNSRTSSHHEDDYGDGDDSAEAFEPSQSAKAAVETADFGKLRQKTKRKQFELRQAVQRNRLEAIRSRRKGLATLSLFTFVSIQKLDKGLIEASGSSIKEAMFLILLHHLVMKCEEILRVIQGGEKHGGAHGRNVPALGDSLGHQHQMSPHMRGQDTPRKTTRPTSSSAPSPSQAPKLSMQSGAFVNESDELSLVSGAKQSSIQARKFPESRKLDSKLVFTWAKSAAKAYAMALNLTDSSLALQLIRHLDRYVLHLLNPVGDCQGPDWNGRKYKGHKQRVQTMNRHQHHTIHPLVYNPQPAKRHLVTFSSMTEQRILQKMSSWSFQGTIHGARHSLPDGTNPFADDSVESASVSPPHQISSQGLSHEPSKLGSIFNRLQQHRSFFLDDSGREEKVLEQRRSFLHPQMSPDDLENIIDPSHLEDGLDEYPVIDELAERLALLPERLTRTVIHCIEEDTIRSDALNALNIHHSLPQVSSSAPILDMGHVDHFSTGPKDAITVSHMDTEELAGDLFATAPFDEELVPWMTEDGTDLDPPLTIISSSEQPSPHKESHVSTERVLVPPGQRSFMPEPLSPQTILDLESAPVQLAENDIRPHSVGTVDPRENHACANHFFTYIPFHTMMFWEALYLLFKNGVWDSLLEDVLLSCARSLDIDPFLYGLLVSYTADLVAEQDLQMEAKHYLASTSKGAPTRMASTTGASTQRCNKSRQPSPSNRNEVRTLATTSTHQLRMSKAISRGKVLKIAGMALGVGALSALTAGIAAPAFAAGFGALGIAGTSGFATFLGSAGGSAALASLFGASSASLSGWKISRRLADIKVFEFVHLHSNYVMDGIAGYISEIMELYTESTLKHRPQFRSSLGIAHLVGCSNEPSRKIQPPFDIVIGISGWLNTIEDATKPWMCMADSLGTDLFALKWEPQLLTELGFMMIRMVGENVASSAASLALQMTMTATGSFIMWPVNLLQYAGQLDNTWLTCRHRAQQAGTLLAAALTDRSLVGNRPVTLIGYSMGSRVITYCLKELYRRGEFNRVKDVVVMGLPGSKQRETWKKMRAVVAGRLVNVYCSSDWILAFLYRWMEWGVQVAGLSAVDGVPGVENVDVTGIVISHNHYEKRIPEILSFIKFHSSFAHWLESMAPPSRTGERARSSFTTAAT